jgi:methionyl-tRNA synthetase
MYVWLDALLNYITALEYDTNNSSFWPCNTHFVGKDILKFHAIYWPAFLMSLKLPLPKHIAAHGWWTKDGSKMSKSKGNVIDPIEIANTYGLENFRYFVLREVPFGGDGDFSEKALIDRINSDLGNSYGNLLNRIIGMSNKYFDGLVDTSNIEKFYGEETSKINEILNSVEPFLYQVQIHKYLEMLWNILSISNKSIDENKPWELMKNSKEDKVMALIAMVANALAKFSILLHPIMPKTTNKVANVLAFEINKDSFVKLIDNKEILNSFTIKSIEPIFPRIEEKPSIKEEKLENKTIDNSGESLISIDEFFNTKIRLGTIIEASEIKKSKKLLLVKVDLGSYTKQIVAGIKEFYSPDDLLGSQVCVVDNLKPTKLMGILSEGMLLAAKDKDGLSLMRVESKKENGTKIS